MERGQLAKHKNWVMNTFQYFQCLCALPRAKRMFHYFTRDSHLDCKSEFPAVFTWPAYYFYNTKNVHSKVWWAVKHVYVQTDWRSKWPWSSVSVVCVSPQKVQQPHTTQEVRWPRTRDQRRGRQGEQQNNNGSHCHGAQSIRWLSTCTCQII